MVKCRKPALYLLLLLLIFTGLVHGSGINAYAAVDESDSLIIDTSVPNKGTTTEIEYDGFDGTKRKAVLYLPYGYNASDKTQMYNVMVLMPGTTDWYVSNRADWLSTKQGSYTGAQILDDVFYNGLAEPFIAVSIDQFNVGYASARPSMSDANRATELRNLIAYLNLNYNTYGSADGLECLCGALRAHYLLAGVSEGAYRAVDVGLGYLLDVFGYFGFFSTSSAGAESTFTTLDSLLSTYPVFGAYTSYGTGTYEQTYQSRTKTLVNRLTLRSIPAITWQYYGINHQYSQNFHKSLYNMAQEAFENCDCPQGTTFSIQKNSANTALTGGNSGYSLAGAVYGIYKTLADASANKNVLETITTNAGGTATTSGKYSPGTYYIKELTASKGYLLDITVHAVTLSANGTLSGQTAFTETPADAPELVRIKKVVDGSLLTGAVFKVDFYPNDSWSGNPARTWYYRTVDGVIDLLSESCLDTSRQNSAFYKNTPGANTFPLGTVRVTEVEAPEGYVKADFRLDGKITQPSSGGKAVFSWTSPADSTIRYEADGTAAVENEVIRGNLKILKQDGVETTPLAGAVYQVRDAEEKTVAEGTTDESGTVSFTGLPYGSYSYAEIRAPKGYVLDDMVYPFSITENGVTVSQVRDNVRREGTLHVEKLNGGKPLAGAVFLLEYSTDGGGTWQSVTLRGEGDAVPAGGCTSPAIADGTLTTDECGKVSFTGLRADGGILYRLTEVKAPEGYTLLSEPLYTGTLPVALTSEDAEDSETFEGQHYGYTLYVKVNDGQVFRLPQTGGAGFAFIPLALLTLAIIYAFVVYYTGEKHNKLMLRSAAELNKNQKSD